MPIRQSCTPLIRRWSGIAALATLFALTPLVASAQLVATGAANQPPGEKYHIEFAASFWNPNVSGQVSSNLGSTVGTTLDFVNDLGFQQTRFGDVRLVLRPSTRNKFRFEYTPIQYTATSSLPRTVTFNGQTYSFNLPVASELDWKVMRFGYEYDLLSRSRGYIGFLIEGRYTQFKASLTSLVASGVVSANAPLPAIGVVGRGYVVKNVSITGQVTGLRVPQSWIKNFNGNYYDWEFYGTVDLCRYVGVQGGWRRVTTFLDVVDKQEYVGNFKFQGLWFGGVVRY